MNVMEDGSYRTLNNGTETPEAHVTVGVGLDDDRDVFKHELT